MAEGVKHKMNIDRFEQIFARYSFEEKKEILNRLKTVFKTHGRLIKGDLQKQIDSIDADISEADNQF